MANGEKNQISVTEALEFVKNRLEIEDVDALLANDRFEFIKRLSYNWLQRIPFTTLKQLSLPLPRTARPIRDLCDDVMQGLGGRCSTLVPMLYALLRALGYECHTAIASVQDPQDHACLFVHNLQEEGDMFIVEIAIGYPSFTPLKLKDAETGFVDETEEVTHSFLTYKYKRLPCDDDRVVFERLHLMTSGICDGLGRPYFKTRDDKWGVMYTMDVAEVSLEYINKTIEKVSLNVEHKFNKLALAFKYPHGRTVVLRNTSGVLEDEHGKMSTCKLENADAIREFVEKYFPEIPADMLAAALEYWKSVQ